MGGTPGKLHLDSILTSDMHMNFGLGFADLDFQSEIVKDMEVNIDVGLGSVDVRVL